MAREKKLKQFKLKGELKKLMGEIQTYEKQYKELERNKTIIRYRIDSSMALLCNRFFLAHPEIYPDMSLRINTEKGVIEEKNIQNPFDGVLTGDN